MAERYGRHSRANGAFSVTAYGYQLGFQWQFNGSNIFGATNATLVLTNIQAGTAGNYDVVVSNGIYSSVDNPVTLDIYTNCISAPLGLVSLWQADNNLVDYVGQNVGTNNGGLTFGAGESGEAFAFNGTDAYVGIPASPSLNIGAAAGLTIECWIQPVDFSRAQQLVEWDNDTGGFGVQLAHSQQDLGGPGALFANLTDTGGGSHYFYSPSGILTLNVFQHVALTYNKSTGQGVLYLNGHGVATNSLGVFTPQTTYGVNLGARIPALNFFNGLLDEVGLYNRALSAAEIQQIYNEGAIDKAECLAPQILAQPQSQSVSYGNNVTFNIGAFGSELLTSQWFQNGSPIASATNGTLTLTNITTANIADYTVVVSNTLGSVTSLVASLNVPLVQISANGTVLTNGQYQMLSPVTIKLQNFFATGDVFYTLDGSTPSAGSSLYTNTFVLTNTATIQALGYSSDFSQSSFSGPVTINVAPAYGLNATTPGGGHITLNPIGTSFLPGSSVKLTATPSNGWTFLQWQGDVAGTNPVQTVLMSRSKSAQAIFGTTVSHTSPAGGAIVFNPAGGIYPYGTPLQVIAVPGTGSNFVIWGSSASGSVNPLIFNVTNPSPTISALFGALTGGKVSLAVVPVGHGRASISPLANNYTPGQSITLTATPDAGKSFLGWAGSVTNTQNPLMLTLNQSEVIYANFTTNHLLSLQLGPGTGTSEGVELDLNGEPGIHYRLDGSSNLVDWVALLSLTNYVGDIHYIDTNAVAVPYHFYRAVVLP